VSNYWLARWIDDQNITTWADAERLLRDKSFAKRTLAEAAAATPPTRDPIRTGRAPIVAGAQIDLSGDLSCNHRDCLRAQVDDLFRRVWHYFDEIVVVGYDPRDVDFDDPTEDEDRLLHQLSAHIATYLYLRSAGAEDWLIFREKQHWCAHHLEVDAGNIGIERILGHREEYIRELLEGGILAEPPVWKDGAWQVMAYDAHNGVVIGVRLRRSQKTSIKKLERLAAETVFHANVDSLAGDVMAARNHRAPLATVYGVHSGWIAETHVRATEGDVAYELALPVLEGLPLKDIIRVRNEQWTGFEAFRLALRTAIRERVSTADSESAQQIAQEIANDVIEPALNNISRRLAAAHKTMNRKIWLHGGVGLAVATVGLLACIPLISAAGMGAVGLGLPHVDKYFDELHDIELEDMYFLWGMETRHASC
jgi:hypothetical protein